MHANDSRVGMASIFLGRNLENNCILEICQEQSSGVVYIYCYHEYSSDFTNYLYSNT